MVAKDLKITGFRNLIDIHVRFCDRKNLIYGLNGAGKTSILEAIFLLGFGKSFLSVKKSDIINHHADEFSIKLNMKGPPGVNELRGFYTGNRFLLFLNEKKTNIMEVNRILYPVLFSSSNYNLYIESQPYIRKLMNRFIFGVNSLYIHYILSYNRALKQKKQLLKKRKNLSELSSWNRIMSEMGTKIVENRIEFVEKMKGEVHRRFKKELDIFYRPSVGLEGNLNEETFFEELEKMKEFEIDYKRPLKGPHLDSYEFGLNGKNLKFFSSGEKKIHLLMVYISFIELFKSINGEYPLFLVDDYDSAIDNLNVDFLLDHYPGMQVIATSVNNHHRFHHSIELKKEN